MVIELLRCRGLSELIKITSLNKEESEALMNIAKALSYFVGERMYGYVDMLANAYPE